MKKCCDSSEKGEILKSEPVGGSAKVTVKRSHSASTNSTSSTDSTVNLRKRITFLFGSSAVFFVVILWSLSSYLTSNVLDNYKYPIVVTVANNISFLFYFIFLVLPDPMMEFLKNQKEKDGTVSSAEEAIEIEEGSGGDLENNRGQSTGNNSAVNDTGKLPPLTLKETARIAYIFFILYFLSNFLLNFSLQDGKITSVSNLTSTSGFFTLIIGYVYGVEILSVLRLSAVALSVVATLLSVISPDFSLSSDSTVAAFFALSSAFAYGVYSIYLKKATKDESRVSMPLLFAFVGLYTLLSIIPIMIVCHCTGLYVIELPDRKTTIYIVINAIVGALIPNYMWNIAFSLTTPLMVAIGLAFCTPLGVLAGWFKNEIILPQEVAAIIIIILSFCLLNLASLNKPLDDDIDSKFLSILGLKQPRRLKEKS